MNETSVCIDANYFFAICRNTPYSNAFYERCAWKKTQESSHKTEVQRYRRFSEKDENVRNQLFSALREIFAQILVFVIQKFRFPGHSCDIPHRTTLLLQANLKSLTSNLRCLVNTFIGWVPNKIYFPSKYCDIAKQDKFNKANHRIKFIGNHVWLRCLAKKICCLVRAWS